MILVPLGVDVQILLAVSVPPWDLRNISGLPVSQLLGGETSALSLACFFWHGVGGACGSGPT
eukprot:1137448-Pelagomonas_calceolata.AAC.2